MKTHSVVLGLAIWGVACAQTLVAGAADEATGQQVTQAIASQDAGQVMKVLPAIERFWPQQPNDYFESVKNAAGVLDAAPAMAGARLAISNMFSSMIQKPLSGTPEPVASSLAAKDDAVLYFLNFPEVRQDPTNLLAMAKYLGSIRDQIIPNYVSETVYVNAPGLMGATPAQARQITRENEQNKALNELQEALQNANTILTFHLLHDAAIFPAREPKNTAFIHAVAMAARLSDDEQHELQ